MNNIMGMVAVFIGIAIMLSVGITILSNASAGLDCTDIPGYDATPPTGWGKICLDAAAQAQAGYQLMVVALIVIAAVIILIVVRML
ncbi:MAG: hypothetical protein OXQ29_04785, partial [Rhodospirillaceae bacterium]|nr:hypothetical protein [Rhodospirillaceae bacterium]